VLFVAADAVSGRRASSERWRELAAWSAAVLTALAFSAIKLVPAVNALASATLGPMLLDPTDLAALPSTLLAALWLLRPSAPAPAVARSRPRLGALVAFVLIGAACLA